MCTACGQNAGPRWTCTRCAFARESSSTTSNSNCFSTPSLILHCTSALLPVICVCVCVCMYTYKHTYIHPYVHTCVHTHMLIVYIYEYIYVYYVLRYMDICMYTYVCILYNIDVYYEYIYIRIYQQWLVRLETQRESEGYPG
jgi:hypothetical protein